MLKRSYCGEEKIICDSGINATLYYYLLEEKSGDCDSFGIEVAMVRSGTWESASVHHITTSAALIDSLLERLKRNTVTPCTLQEIVIEEINKY